MQGDYIRDLALGRGMSHRRRKPWRKHRRHDRQTAHRKRAEGRASSCTSGGTILAATRWIPGREFETQLLSVMNYFYYAGGRKLDYSKHGSRLLTSSRSVRRCLECVMGPFQVHCSREQRQWTHPGVALHFEARSGLGECRHRLELSRRHRGGASRRKLNCGRTVMALWTLSIIRRCHHFTGTMIGTPHLRRRSDRWRGRASALSQDVIHVPEAPREELIAMESGEAPGMRASTSLSPRSCSERCRTRRSSSRSFNRGECPESVHGRTRVGRSDLRIRADHTRPSGTTAGPDPGGCAEQGPGDHHREGALRCERTRLRRLHPVLGPSLRPR